MVNTLEITQQENRSVQSKADAIAKSAVAELVLLDTNKDPEFY